MLSNWLLLSRQNSQQIGGDILPTHAPLGVDLTLTSGQHLAMFVIHILETFWYSKNQKKDRVESSFLILEKMELVLFD